MSDCELADKYSEEYICLVCHLFLAVDETLAGCCTLWHGACQTKKADYISSG